MPEPPFRPTYRTPATTERFLTRRRHDNKADHDALNIDADTLDGLHDYDFALDGHVHGPERLYILKRVANQGLTSGTVTEVDWDTVDTYIGAFDDLALNYIILDKIGTWSINGYGFFAANATGDRNLMFYTGTGADITTATDRVGITVPAATLKTRLSISEHIVTGTTTTRLWLSAFQDSGTSPLNLEEARLSAVFLGI